MRKSRVIPAALFVFILILALIAVGCAGEGSGSDRGENTDENTERSETMSTEEENKYRELKYSGPFSAVNGAFSAADALGRVLPLDVTVEEREDGVERTVGIFYFLWKGQHGKNGPYDNSVIEKAAGATESEEAWVRAGGGQRGEMHFWGKPLFGYYFDGDSWVMRKHVQMLTDAGIDYLVFDATNAYTYTSQALTLFKILLEYQKAGWDVPRVAFYTNTSSGKTMNAIYNEIYKAHPEYESIWYKLDGKPMIIGDPNDPALSDDVKAFFRIKLNQWPFDPKKDDGFPWMEFSRLLTDDAVYGKNGVKEILNVSIAQHNVTCTMSAAAWYGAGDRTRSWHDGANGLSPDAVLYGYNFAEQWEWALKQNVQSIFVTGWNEWVAQRGVPTEKYPVFFVDCCNPNTSRDAEPMDGLFGDNYYMQLIDGIRRFKGTDPRVDVGSYVTVDVHGDPSQFDVSTAVYVDYTGDDVDRNATGFGGKRYSDTSGLNDLTEIRVLRDRSNLYFRMTVKKDIMAASEKNRMSLYLDVTDPAAPIKGIPADGDARLNGYNFAVNRAAYDDGRMVIEKWNGTEWVSVGCADFEASGNVMMISVSRDLLGIPGIADGDLDPVCVNFKFADGGDASDVFSFYTKGDAAPYGRMNFVYSNVK